MQSPNFFASIVAKQRQSYVVDRHVSDPGRLWMTFCDVVASGETPSKVPWYEVVVLRQGFFFIKSFVLNRFNSNLCVVIGDFRMKVRREVVR